MFKNKAGQFRAGWMILLAFILMFAGQILFTIPGFIVILFTQTVIEEGGMSIEIDAANDWIFLLTNGVGTLGGLVATLLVWRLINRQKFARIGLRWNGKDFIFGLLLGAVSITIIFFILYALGHVTLLNSLAAPQFSIFTFLFLILFIIVGLFEEIFFRGYIISTMASRNNNKWFMYIASAVIFSLIHGSNPNVTILGLINIAFVGLLFAYMFDVTKSLWLPIGYHITWNYFQGNVFGFAVSGLAPNGLYELELLEGNELLTGGSFGLEGGLIATILIGLGFVFTYLYGKKLNRQNEPTFW